MIFLSHVLLYTPWKRVRIIIKWNTVGEEKFARNLPMPKSVCAPVEHRKLETNGLSIGPPYLYLSLVGILVVMPWAAIHSAKLGLQVTWALTCGSHITDQLVEATCPSSPKIMELSCLWIMNHVCLACKSLDPILEAWISWNVKFLT